MTETVVWIAIALAWVSGWGCAGIMDALWGFTEWDRYSVFLVTALWAICGTIAIALVIA